LFARAGFQHLRDQLLEFLANRSIRAKTAPKNSIQDNARLRCVIPEKHWLDAKFKTSSAHSLRVCSASLSCAFSFKDLQRCVFFMQTQGSRVAVTAIISRPAQDADRPPTLCLKSNNPLRQRAPGAFHQNARWGACCRSFVLNNALFKCSNGFHLILYTRSPLFDSRRFAGSSPSSKARKCILMVIAHRVKANMLIDGVADQILFIGE